jgi:hypothetical protein
MQPLSGRTAMRPTTRPEFNPADGTLTGVSLTLTGSATAETQENPGALSADLVSTIAEPVGNGQFFVVTGSSAVDFNLSGNIPADSTKFFIGTGDYLNPHVRSNKEKS